MIRKIVGSFALAASHSALRFCPRKESFEFGHKAAGSVPRTAKIGRARPTMSPMRSEESPDSDYTSNSPCWFDQYPRLQHGPVSRDAFEMQAFPRGNTAFRHTDGRGPLPAALFSVAPNWGPLSFPVIACQHMSPSSFRFHTAPERNRSRHVNHLFSPAVSP